MDTKPDPEHMTEVVKTCISAIRYALAHTANELKALKAVRHRFDPYNAEKYKIMKRRATLLHVALRTNRISLNKKCNTNNINDYVPHCQLLALDGPWSGERHVFTEPGSYKHKVRPCRTREPDRRKPPRTQPLLMLLTATTIVSWTRLVNNWATCCGYAGRIFHLDSSVDHLIACHARGRLAREQAAKDKAKAERNGATIN